MPAVRGREASKAKANEHWSLGDLVLAKVKGFPAWPAKISRPEDWGKTPDSKKCFVQFFGTKEIAFVTPTDIQAFTSESKKKLSAHLPSTTENFAQAVKEICAAFDVIQNQKTSGPVMAPVTAKANEQLSLGDLVLAKVKGFPAWPAKISRPQDWDKAPDPKKCFVQFFGTKEIAFVTPTDIKAFTSESKKKLSAHPPGKTENFAQAVKEICAAFDVIQNQKTSGPVMAPVKAKASEQLSLGDLVLAKVKGFPAWPAKISRPQDWDKAPDPKKCFVQLFGTKEIAFVTPTDIKAFTSESKKKLSAHLPGKTENFALAVKEICAAFDVIQNQKTSGPVMAPPVKAKANEKLSLGDLVLVKVKGFPAWPAKISRPEDWDKGPDPKKCFVQFFGTEEIAFVTPTDIQAFTSEFKKKLSAHLPGKTENFAEAVKEICAAFDVIQNQKTSCPVMAPVKAKAKEQLSLGNLVLAKVKGFPAWPAKISRPEDWDKAPDPKKCFVQIFGTKEIAFVTPTDIQAFTSESKEKLSAHLQGKTEHFAQAVKEICAAFDEIQDQKTSGLADDTDDSHVGSDAPAAVEVVGNVKDVNDVVLTNAEKDNIYLDIVGSNLEHCTQRIRETCNQDEKLSESGHPNEISSVSLPAIKSKLSYLLEIRNNANKSSVQGASNVDNFGKDDCEHGILTNGSKPRKDVTGSKRRIEAADDRYKNGGLSTGKKLKENVRYLVSK